MERRWQDVSRPFWLVVRVDRGTVSRAQQKNLMAAVESWLKNQAPSPFCDLFVVICFRGSFLTTFSRHDVFEYGLPSKAVKEVWLL